MQKRKVVESSLAIINENEQEVTLFEDDEYDEDPLPITHKVDFSDHKKTITSITIDPTGSRMATGSRDTFVKLW